MMTGYYKGKLKVSDDDVADLLVKYFSKHDRLFKDRGFSKGFYQVFRHGLAHGSDVLQL
jgi:hypothetical protein